MAKNKRKIQARPKATPTRPAAEEAVEPAKVRIEPDDLVFGRQTFIWVGVGIGLMLLGMLLMAGGSMPSPDVWDESLIYSFRRITLAPIVILAGLGVITWAILKK